MKRVRKAVFPVAGFGTRFLPVTKAVPKELLPVLNKPLIHYAVEEALAAGIEEILFINGRGKNSLEDYFDASPELEMTLDKAGKKNLLEQIQKIPSHTGSFAFVRQVRALGLGHAVLCAQAWVGEEPFAVILPDDFIMAEIPCLQQMIASYELELGNMATVVTVPKNETNKYGILDPHGKEEKASLIKAKGVVEKPTPQEAPSNHAIIGRYILHPQIFSFLRKQKAGVGGEIQLTDALQAMIPEFGLHGFKMQGHRFDCGSIEGMLAANIAIGFQDQAVKEKVSAMLTDCQIDL